MTQALTHELEVEFTDDEKKALTAKAKAVGLDPETYLRVRVLTAHGLPEPAAFFALSRRLASFAQDYEAGLHAMAQRQPGAVEQCDALAKTFAQLLQDWDDFYGPR